jgi:Cu(I)/Ag(I) efflux system periplasmic protein CusF
MRKIALTLTTGLALTFAATVAQAQSALVDGEVKKVDASAGKLTIKHGAIKSMQMDEGMTHVWRAQDPAMLKDLKAGAKIRFEPANINGQFTVMRLEKR